MVARYITVIDDLQKDCDATLIVFQSGRGLSNDGSAYRYSRGYNDERRSRLNESNQ